MRRKSKVGKVIGILLCVVLFAALFTFIVMSLWNAILPAVIGVKAITFWQALGILILSKILFGGFGGGHKWKERGGQRWKERMMSKWGNMTEEEKEQFKNSWEARCGRPWRRPFGGQRFEEKKPEDSREAGAE
ncbi:hypothetical protein [Pseudobacter ginsenosidimutans]|uniref:Uncharacterized protein n=1 Tax=Pseudobacter ginsenosidimutans TaxID=661488 RepID=A0A4Q7MVW7_9BACT|nr:hypothetical protein [Pseudobacter ginsenosidimutans]RZS72174.1 hypothetical protein EV199_4090 [Pseudobacter ginsenosidimutans]